MARHCRFCEIVRNEAPASCVYEDDKVMAFLDIMPVSEGHTLVVPKKHYENIYEIPDEEVAYLFKIVRKVACAVKKSMKAEGIGIFQNNGKAAGQVVFHLHVHIIPRHERHESCRPHEECQPSRLDAVAYKIRQFI